MTGIPKLLYAKKESHQAYIAFELVGKNLLQVMLKRNEVYGPQEVVKIGVDILSTLESLHMAGYLNRDIKPDNLTIRNPDKSFQ